MKRILRIVFWALLGLIAAAALVAVFWPKPIGVELASVARGPLVVTVEGDGRTRIKERFIVSAPVTGQMPRVELHAGDRVALGATLVEITPTEPPLLDERTRAQAEAQVKLAVAGKAQSSARLSAAEATREFARSELARVETLVRSGAVNRSALEEAQLRIRTADADVQSAQFGARMAQYQIEMAQAALSRLTGGRRGGADHDKGTRVVVCSPIEGKVLRVIQESAGLVQAGAPLLEIGDPATLEIVVDLLSMDAVAVQPGSEAQIDQWGGDRVLEASVRLVEPSAFTKVSALGIEEQRVNVIADFTGPREAYRALGDGFRAHAQIVIWKRQDTIKLPMSALFRQGDGWVVFVVAEGRAHLRAVTIGRRGVREVEVLGGVAEGDRIIVHPGDQVTDGVRVEAR
jgi:HlyD family secretion protein